MKPDLAEGSGREERLVELVIGGKSGDRQALESLWDATEKFIRWSANRRYRLTGPVGGTEAEDLLQAGYEAMLEAVKRFDPERPDGNFVQLLAYCLSHAFARCQGIGRRCPLDEAESLDEELSDGSDDKPRTIGECIPDPAAEEAFTLAEEEIFNGELHKALERAVSRLSSKQAVVIRDHYFRGLPLEKIGLLEGVSQQACQEREKTALKNLRRQQAETGLDRFATELFVAERTPFYLSVSAEGQRRTGTSSVERIVEIRENLRNFAERIRQSEE